MSQIYTGIVKNLMISILPQETAGYIIYLSLVGNKCRCTILAIVLFKLFLPKSSLLHRFCELLRVPKSASDTLLPDSDPTSGPWTQMERSHLYAESVQRAPRPGIQKTMIHVRFLR